MAWRTCDRTTTGVPLSRLTLDWFFGFTFFVSLKRYLLRLTGLHVMTLNPVHVEIEPNMYKTNSPNSKLAEETILKDI